MNIAVSTMSVWRWSNVTVRRGCLSVGRRYPSLTVVVVVALCVVVCTRLWWLAEVAGSALQPPPPLHRLDHFRRSRSLRKYFDDIQLLIEPSSTRCEGAEEVPFIVVVSSTPDNLDQRGAIRDSWAKHLPTFFFLGVDGKDREGLLVDNYIEAKETGDMVVYDFLEHYDNLTLKTALMLHWSQRRCAFAGAILKTDDDVLVNPWMMREVLKAHENHPLIGYKLTDTRVHRDEHSKWYTPRWLYPQGAIPEYLSGNGYIIQGDYIKKILKASFKVPLINLEDVYFTHNVAKSALSLSLSHDRRLSPYKPFVPISCSYWGLALSHSMTPDEIVGAWKKIERLGERFDTGEKVCSILGFLSKDQFLY